MWGGGSLVWDRQIFLMEILLPATFLLVAVLAYIGPYISGGKK